MVEARERFLAGGFYAPVRRALVAAAAKVLGEDEPKGGLARLHGAADVGAEVDERVGGAAGVGAGIDECAGVSAGEGAAGDGYGGGVVGGGLVVEVGAGTGYYLAGVVGAGRGRRGVALDVSRYAVRRAARVDPGRIGAVVCDAWRELPVRDGAAQVVLNVFAPRNASEMARILAPGGSLLVVTPNQGHLRELVGVLGLVRVDEEKERRLTESLAGSFIRTGGEVVEVAMRLDHEAVERLVAMTPSARHADSAELAERIAVLADPLQVTLSVTLSTWQTV